MKIGELATLIEDIGKPLNEKFEAFSFVLPETYQKGDTLPIARIEPLSSNAYREGSDKLLSSKQQYQIQLFQSIDTDIEELADKIKTELYNHGFTFTFETSYLDPDLNNVYVTTMQVSTVKHYEYKGD
ncbi:hypothetical protein A2G24_00995 [Listeria monocytogenes]|uniref:DUF3168 domain-containing protein n=1 Tax=Listeria monocytogenes TaxID=1639 RepID=A0A823DKX7_LISMN|nr:hypothetical protein [Listeria monocytogenes]EAD1012202.1 hypothetical protein [Listeria monocytogenes]EAD1186109.1 hypothetical protein [Listeria monocytogenes]EAF8898028.1 hypothetical protein [Listeria monocytogenes]